MRTLLPVSHMVDSTANLAVNSGYHTAQMPRVRDVEVQSLSCQRGSRSTKGEDR